MKQIKGIIFDMDGILVDSEPIQLKAMNLALAEYNVTLTKNQWKMAEGRRTADIIEWIKSIYEIVGRTEDIIRKKNKIYRHLILSEVELIPGVLDVISNLKQKNYLLAVASSSILRDINITLEKFSILHYFNTIVSGDHVQNGKPAPDIFLRVANNLELTPEELLVLEDTEVGVISAKSAGMLCIAIPRNFSRNQGFEIADYVYDDIRDLSIENLKK